MIERRTCLGVVALGLFAPLAAMAQAAGKVPRVALVFGGTPLADMVGTKPASPNARAFLHRLRDLGYLEGRNIVVERRSAEGRMDRLTALMREVVAIPVDVIVAVGPGVFAARSASMTIPVVANIDDPVASGVTDSLARPTRGITGIPDSSGLEMYSKRLQLLKELAPNATRVGVIDTGYVSARETPGTHRRRREIEAAARTLGLALVHGGADNIEQLDSVFGVFAKERVDSVIEMNNPITFAGRRAIVAFAASHGLPAVYSSREFVDAGGLASYGPNLPAIFARLADFVDKVLKGAKVADLPFEYPTQYDLVVRLATAKALALTVPHALRLRASEVIE